MINSVPASGRPKLAGRYLVCRCGEVRQAAISHRHGCCFNCAPAWASHAKPVTCLVCNRQARGQDHHVAGWRHDLRTIPLCLSCHQVATALQRDWPRGLGPHAYWQLGCSDLVWMAQRFGRGAVVLSQLVSHQP